MTDLQLALLQLREFKLTLIDKCGGLSAVSREVTDCTEVIQGMDDMGRIEDATLTRGQWLTLLSLAAIARQQMLIDAAMVELLDKLAPSVDGGGA
jgi:hypothetical protein